MSSAACKHESCSFDRSVCACGSMHDYCDECGAAMDCPLDNEPQEQSAASTRTFNALHHIEEGWRLVERYCERYPSDWRLVFRRDDGCTLEISVAEEVWRAFDLIQI